MFLRRWDSFDHRIIFIVPARVLWTEHKQNKKPLISEEKT